MQVNQFQTLTEALTSLKSRGFTLDFNLSANQIACTSANLQLSPKQFEVVEYHRFEGDSDPADMAIVYGIESHDGKKGVLVNGYGATSDTIDADLVKKLSVPEHKQ